MTIHHIPLPVFRSSRPTALQNQLDKYLQLLQDRHELVIVDASWERDREEVRQVADAFKAEVMAEYGRRFPKTEYVP